MPDPIKEPKPPEHKAAPSFKRRQVLVDPELQIGLSTEMVGWIYVYFMVFAVLANVPHIIALLQSAPEDAAYLGAMDHIRSFASSVVLPMGITFVAMAVHGVYMTHRIAGPMVRFKRAMREVAARRLPRTIGLRQKDHFKDLADEMNAAVAVLREDAARRTRMAGDAYATVHRLLKTLERQPGNSLREATTICHAALDEIEALSRHLATQAEGESAAPKPVPLADADLPAVVSVDMDEIDTATTKKPAAAAPAAPAPKPTVTPLAAAKASGVPLSKPAIQPMPEKSASAKDSAQPAGASQAANSSTSPK